MSACGRVSVFLFLNDHLLIFILTCGILFVLHTYNTLLYNAMTDETIYIYIYNVAADPDYSMP